jgi:hypothetical protein
MPIHPQIATAFYNTYLHMRWFSTWQTNFGWVRSLWRDDQQIKTDHCVYFNNKFYNKDKKDENDILINGSLADPLKKEIDSWVSIFREICIDYNDNLVIASTMHAIRSYYIAELKKSEASAQAFTNYLNDLRIKADACKTTIASENKKKLQAVEKREYHLANEIREAIPGYKKQYINDILLLAFLGESAAICEVAENEDNLFGAFFKELLCPNLSDETIKKLPKGLRNNLNELIPLYYHPNYYEIHFEIYCRHRPNIGDVNFKKFEEDKANGNITEIIDPKGLKKDIEPEATLSNTVGTIFYSVGAGVSSLLGYNQNPSSSNSHAGYKR